MTGRKQLPSKLSCHRRIQERHSTPARGLLGVSIGSMKQRCCSIGRTRLAIRNNRSIPSAPRCCKRRDSIERRWFSASGQQRTILGFTRLGRSRHCWQTWINAKRPRATTRPRLMRISNISPIPCAQLLFEWGVGAMRRGDLDRADALLAELDVILPDHVPGRGHRAEVALARGELDAAAALIAPLLEISDAEHHRLAQPGTVDGRSRAARRQDLHPAGRRPGRLQGRNPTDSARDIEKALSKYIRDPVVTVVVTGFVGPTNEQIRVIGEATRAAVLAVSART